MAFLSILILGALTALGYFIFVNVQSGRLSLPIDQSPLYKDLLAKVKELTQQPKATQPKATKKSKEPKESIGSPSTKQAVEGSHVPKAKGDYPVIEDRGNGKKEVVSGDKSILIDEIRSKHFSAVDKKFEEATSLREKYVKAKQEGSPDKGKCFEEYDACKKEAEKMKEVAVLACFKEVQTYIIDEDAIDLHGLYIDSAVEMLKATLEERKKNGKNILKVSCGMGHHNTVGFSKIKEAVVKYCADEKLKHSVDDSTGFVTINF
ncbi:Smr domain-containing protein [Entamoeba marina]